MGTVAILGIILICVILAIRKIISNKKKGINSCGENCASCPMSDTCHEKNKKQE